MSDNSKTRTDAEKELLSLYKNADPDTQKAFIDALKGEKLNAADIMAMLTGLMNDPNVAALFESMKKMLGKGKDKDKEMSQSLLAFTFFYSSSIYALLLCFFYMKWKAGDITEQADEAEEQEE